VCGKRLIIRIISEALFPGAESNLTVPPWNSSGFSLPSLARDASSWKGG